MLLDGGDQGPPGPGQALRQAQAQHQEPRRGAGEPRQARHRGGRAGCLLQDAGAPEDRQGEGRDRRGEGEARRQGRGGPDQGRQAQGREAQARDGRGAQGEVGQGRAGRVTAQGVKETAAGGKRSRPSRVWVASILVLG